MRICEHWTVFVIIINIIIIIIIIIIVCDTVFSVL